MNCESWLDPKNSLIEAATGLALMISCGIRFSASASDSRSFTALSTRTRPRRNWFSTISPTERTRRLPRWSISSTVPWPLRILINSRKTSMMSSLVSTPLPITSVLPSRRLNFIRPTAERSYRSDEKNRLSNRACAASLAGGSPGRIIR